MTISSHVQKQFFATTSPVTEELIRLPPTVVTQYAKESLDQENSDTAKKPSRAQSTRRRRTNLWTIEEHERFLQGLEQFPIGPWKEISAIVGTKTTRQTMTHAQKYRQKIERRMRLGPLGKTTRGVPQTHGNTEDLATAGKPQDKRVAIAPAAVSQVLSGMSSPLDVAVDDFFDPSVFGQDLASLLDDVDPQWASMASEMHYSF